jgi:hypothetical protein
VTATSSRLREGNHLREGEMNSRFDGPIRSI